MNNCDSKNNIRGKIMKKLISIFLIFSACTCILAGCSKKPTESNQILYKNQIISLLMKKMKWNI